MKKTLVAVAAILGAVALNASTVNWTGAGISSSGSSLPTANYTAFLIDDAAYAYSDLSASTLSSAIAAALHSTTLTWTTAATPTGQIPTNTKPTDSYVAADTPKYYMVVLDAATVADAKNFLVSNTKTGKVTSTGALSMSFGSLAGKSWQSVPEPTSGLLLLLGMAGLALRRRRA